MTFDITAVFIMTRNILYHVEEKWRTVFKKAIIQMHKFICPVGILVVLYITFLAPVCGLGMGISLTENFAIPDFITSVILKSMIGKIAYYALMVFLLALGITHMFVFDFMIFKDMKLKDALKASKKLFDEHWRSILKRMFIFELRAGIIYLLILFLTGGLPALIITVCDDQLVERFIAVFASFMKLLLIGLYGLMFVPFQFMRITQIFDGYEFADMEPVVKKYKGSWRLYFQLAVLTVVLALLSGTMALQFDEIFPKVSDTEIIAHRCGGNLGFENSTEALQMSIERGVYAAETDVQRTKDGCYIINHDSDFSRLYGDKRKPSQMTLEEVLALSTEYEGKTYHPETVEDILDAAKGKIHVYLELKVTSLDTKMCDDLYEIVKEKDMLDEVAFICLNYDEVAYMEEQHPDAETIYLCYMSYGEIEDLIVDGFGLEEETATALNITLIQDVNKRIDVWTCNNEDSIQKFLISGASGIITDEVDAAIEMKERIENWSDVTRITKMLTPDL